MTREDCPPTTWLANSFSLNMLRDVGACRLEVVPVDLATARAAAEGAISAVGHQDTADLFGQLLGRAVPADRRTVVLALGHRVLVGQYIGSRLAEGAESRPRDGGMQWFVVTVSPPD